MSIEKSAACGPSSRPSRRPRKKTAQAIQQEVAREVDRFLRLVFQERRASGCYDLDAVETAMRSAMHQAGAAALTQLLRYDPPDQDHRTISCPCGRSAHYKELRSKTMLTVLGPQHLWKIAALLHPQDAAAKKLWMTPMKDLLDGGDIEPLVTRLREIAAAYAATHPDLAEEVVREADYFATNAERMEQ